MQIFLFTLGKFIFGFVAVATFALVALLVTIEIQKGRRKY